MNRECPRKMFWNNRVLQCQYCVRVRVVLRERVLERVLKSMTEPPHYGDKQMAFPLIFLFRF